MQALRPCREVRTAILLNSSPADCGCGSKEVKRAACSTCTFMGMGEPGEVRSEESSKLVCPMSYVVGNIE